MTLRERAMSAFRKWLEREEETSTPKTELSFKLKYRGLTVGVLQYQSGYWTFRYTDEFRQRDDLRPIVEFPEVDRTYQNTELWPFFAMRLPSTKQDAIRKVAAKEEIDITDEVQLLRRFGERTVANPYRLVPT